MFFLDIKFSSFYVFTHVNKQNKNDYKNLFRKGTPLHAIAFDFQTSVTLFINLDLHDYINDQIIVVCCIMALSKSSQNFD